MIRRPPRSTQSRSSAASDVYKRQGLLAEAQKPLNIIYNGQNIGEYLADIVVENLVIVELKVVKCIDGSHIAQTINYLKASSLHYGLILNFKNTPLEIKRVIK